MASQSVDMSPRRAALTAGLAYVALSVLALFANFFVRERLIDRDDPAATVNNIASSEVLFRTGVAAFLLVFILDVVVAWALYVFFRRTSSELSLLAAWFRVVYAAIASTALLSLLVVPQLVDAGGYSAALPVGERNAQAMLFLDAYDYGWSIGLVIFGAHLLTLGFVIMNATYAPRLMGLLVALAGVGYLVGNLASVLVPGYEDYAGVFLLLIAVFAVPGEFWLMGWLLFRAGKAKEPEQPLPGVRSVEAQPVA